MSKQRRKSLKQIEREEYKYYSCDNCKWGDIQAEWCRKFDVPITLIHCCKSFEVKILKQDCTKCIHYNSRKNAQTKCKIGIYNCKGVQNGKQTKF